MFSIPLARWSGDPGRLAGYAMPCVAGAETRDCDGGLWTMTKPYSEAQRCSCLDWRGSFYRYGTRVRTLLVLAHRCILAIDSEGAIFAPYVLKKWVEEVDVSDLGIGDDRGVEMRHFQVPDARYFAGRNYSNHYPWLQN
jgi:hypothetical protein